MSEQHIVLAFQMADALQRLQGDNRSGRDLAMIHGYPHPSSDARDGDPRGPLSVIHSGPDRDDPLFLRLAIDVGEYHALMDIALQDWLGQPLLAFQSDCSWQPSVVWEMAAREGYTGIRWFSYNRRDVALFCTRGSTRAYVDGLRTPQAGRLVLVTDADVRPWATWLSPRRKASNRRLFQTFLNTTAADLSAAVRAGAAKSVFCGDVKEPPCVKPVKQEKTGWCLPAAMESLLGFYGVTIDKAILAGKLFLDPNAVGFPGDKLPDAMKLIESLARLKVERRSSWSWAAAKEELDITPKGCPFLTLSDSHVRTGIGYGHFVLAGDLVKGLMCGDPWDGHTCWEASAAIGGGAITAHPR